MTASGQLRKKFDPAGSNFGYLKIKTRLGRVLSETFALGAKISLMRSINFIAKQFHSPLCGEFHQRKKRLFGAFFFIDPQVSQGIEDHGEDDGDILGGHQPCGNRLGDFGEEEQRESNDEIEDGCCFSIPY